MALKPSEEIFPGPLVFPVRGKEYVVPEVGWANGLDLRKLLEDPEKSDAEQQNRVLLTDEVFEQMVSDKVPAMVISRAALTALVDFRLGREAAEQVWESGLSPEALAPKGAKAEQTQPSSTGEANETPTRASSSGTSSRKGSSTKRKVASK